MLTEIGIDKEDCLEEATTCPDNAECVNTGGSYECVCKFGYRSDGPSSCIGMYELHLQ